MGSGISRCTCLRLDGSETLTLGLWSAESWDCAARARSLREPVHRPYTAPQHGRRRTCRTHVSREATADMTYRISIAIPNYNYAQYLGRTIQSVLDQDDPNVEIVVTDNASADGSADVVRGCNDDRVRVHVNPVNVGFAPNLDRSVEQTTGDHIILLSSDDLMLPGALRTYREILDSVEDRHATVLASRYTTIDADDVPISSLTWPDEFAVHFSPFDPVPESYRISPAAALRWSLRTLKNPFAFATVCYPRPLWQGVGGYLGTRQINPDKWFHWRLLGAAQAVVLSDAELFGYRVHGANQTANAKKSGALKYLQDQYTYTYETADELLELTGVQRSELVDAFVTHDIVARAFVHLAEGDSVEARRFLRFGAAAYPHETRNAAGWWAARIASAVGPLGFRAARSGLRLLEAAESLRRDSPSVATLARRNRVRAHRTVS